MFDILSVCLDLKVHQEAGVQPVVRGQHLAVVSQPAVCGDRVLQPAEPQLQEDSAGIRGGCE